MEEDIVWIVDKLNEIETKLDWLISERKALQLPEDYSPLRERLKKIDELERMDTLSRCECGHLEDQHTSQGCDFVPWDKCSFFLPKLPITNLEDIEDDDANSVSNPKMPVVSSTFAPKVEQYKPKESEERVIEY